MSALRRFSRACPTVLGNGKLWQLNKDETPTDLDPVGMKVWGALRANNCDQLGCWKWVFQLPP